MKTTSLFLILAVFIMCSLSQADRGHPAMTKPDLAVDNRPQNTSVTSSKQKQIYETMTIKRNLRSKQKGDDKSKKSQKSSKAAKNQSTAISEPSSSPLTSTSPPKTSDPTSDDYITLPPSTADFIIAPPTNEDDLAQP
ncbi:hypothetical protein IV203_021686 [Nitzschia inconspicua]|uniref:Uncharacterized protein n=1 Tax=Nitzschia inconspicua TaxID=303405 RepID=A0A9K3K4W7_9STRA|nr:hypothetical protein IV203_022761 [Nitzschia inconspicua]KAG7343678.1 hypothetical protein IV203_021686 [Nitzschia inconspicua]